MLDTLLKLVRWLNTSVPATNSLFSLLCKYDSLSDDDKQLLRAATFQLAGDLQAIQLEIAESIDVHTVATSRTKRVH